MRSTHLILKLIIAALISINLQACGSIQQMIQGTPTFTSTVTMTPSPTGTPTSTPTKTPTPTATPNATVTELAQRKDLMSVEIQKYHDAGYLSSIDGEYRQLDDFEQELAQIAHYQWWRFELSPATFVLSAHFKWSSAIENTNLSGCGIVFAGNIMSGMAVFLDRKNVVLLNYSGYKMPRSGGSGAVNFKHSDEADFTLIVDNISRKITVLVNNEFSIEYVLSGSESLKGYIGYAVISGTNTDYGTRCTITDSKLWIID